MYTNLVLAIPALLLVSLPSVISQASPTTTLPPLGPGCSSDNVVRALQHHYTDAVSYCNSMIPSVTYVAAAPQTTYYTTITSGISTATSTYIARSSDFTNVYRGNIGYSGRPSQFPITYTNNKPSLFTVQNNFPTPTYLTSYDIYHIYTGCTCVVKPNTTSYYRPDYTVITKYIKPTSTSTTTVEGGFITWPHPTYGALCNPSLYVGYQGMLVKTVSATRAVQTISPVPTVRYKFDCCQLCADTYNCLWWRHSTSGACTYVWATDVNNNTSEYDKCPNGYGGIVIGPNASSNQSDAYGLGTCGLSDQAFGEDESSQESTEEEFQFSDKYNCAVFGGSYCA